MADTYYTTLPLRRVVNVLDDDSQIPYEVYECGHGGWMRDAKPAKRRRCAFCAPLGALHVETERQARNDARDGRRYA